MADTPQRLKAQELLQSFNGDVSAAVQALREQAVATRSKKRKVENNNPVLVEFSGVTKEYKLGSEHVRALKEVNIQIREGEFVALTGPSGSGKSTLLQLMGGLDKPSNGNIMINGQNVAKLSDRKLSRFRNRTIGFVFQFFYLQPFLTTEVNLQVPGMFSRVPRTERKQKAKELAGAVGLGERLKHLPKELSGGQMQRAAIARALMNQPKILLADEPTGNLDQENGRAIIDLFETVRKTYGTTIVLVTHDAAIANRADREIVLRDGEVVSL